MIRFHLAFIMLLAMLKLAAQSHESDWDAYVMEVKGKPVSIVVDLGLAAKAPMKDRPFAIVVRTKLRQPGADGQPTMQEMSVLDSLEEAVIRGLAMSIGAIYAGRFTQRGLREFCFYALDSVGYSDALFAAFREYPDYEWLGKAVTDKAWSNYFDMLYPPPDQRDRMRYRRQSDQLRQEGDALKAPRPIEHLLRFKSKTSRDQFLRQSDMNGLTITSIPDLPEESEELPFTLRLREIAIPDYRYIETRIIPLKVKSRAFNGRYAGWVCDPVL
jgi:hypothetical protein